MVHVRYGKVAKRVRQEAAKLRHIEEAKRKIIREAEHKANEKLIQEFTPAQEKELVREVLSAFHWS